MKIVVLNGSPAGKNSVTLQTVNYMQALNPGHEFEVLHVGQQIRSMEKNFGPCKESLESADLILFAYPVYTFLVPAQLHRFIELIKENGVALSGKYATQLSTSKHFYDSTAHRFIADNCADLGLLYIRGLSADMDDILKEKGQKQASDFFDFILWTMKNGVTAPIPQKEGSFAPVKATLPEEKAAKTGRGEVVVVADLPADDEILSSMIARFEQRLSRKVRVVNIAEFPFFGGCLGCFHCASTGKCVYKDGFDDFLRREIQAAEATVFAYKIKDHSMGSRFKKYDDRQFCNGHRTVTMGKPVGYLVDGALSAEPNLRTVMEARAQVGGNHLTRIACNEGDTDREIDALCLELLYALDHDYQQPANFYGVGGMKIFRDLIYTMQGMMREDHRFYKEHGFYDFPQKQRGRILGMYLVGSMMTNPKLSKKLGANMTKGMLMPYESVLKRAGKKK